jgi:uncharacterized protein (TIGR00730 family)
MIKSVCVYGGSNSNSSAKYSDEAFRVGVALAKLGITVYYGGGACGVMGSLADGVMSVGGIIKGVIPQFMVERGWAYDKVEHIVVDDMHIRKKTMLDMADMAIALPGSNGTFEEVLEAITWRQLGLFGGKVVIYNSHGYYDSLIQMFNKATEDGFMNVGVDFFTVANNIDELISLIEK